MSFSLSYGRVPFGRGQQFSDAQRRETANAFCEAPRNRRKDVVEYSGHCYLTVNKWAKQFGYWEGRNKSANLTRSEVRARDRKAQKARAKMAAAPVTKPQMDMLAIETAVTNSVVAAIGPIIALEIQRAIKNAM